MRVSFLPANSRLQRGVFLLTSTPTQQPLHHSQHDTSYDQQLLNQSAHDTCRTMQKTPHSQDPEELLLGLLGRTSTPRLVPDELRNCLYAKSTDSSTERITIADIEKDMSSDLFSQSTTQQPLHEDMRHINPKLKNFETQATTILEHLMDEKELSSQPISDSEETVNAATLKSVEFDEFLIVDEYLSEPEETIEVSSHEPDITIVQNKDDEVEKKIRVISERPEEPQMESKED
ncbi:hypothetical protein Scep_026473 [Stephania cephalantha]|uniref:Uncharacterized protein n=1 Tax=Stephania cephalantha TaxID=152367 RepID=A0AAP0EU31_9MAGN